MSSRQDALRQMLENDPKNSFVRYGLAIDLLNSGLAAEAAGEFETLIRNDPNYVAAYFHAGRALESLGRIEDARTVYQDGIALTGRVGDDHARGELEGALALLG